MLGETPGESRMEKTVRAVGSGERTSIWAHGYANPTCHAQPYHPASPNLSDLIQEREPHGATGAM